MTSKMRATAIPIRSTSEYRLREVKNPQVLSNIPKYS